jgi:hypothetical protein
MRGVDDLTRPRPWIHTSRHQLKEDVSMFQLIRYPPGADPEQLTRHAMTSPEFAADMAGFNADDIVDVQSVLLDPTSSSPIR